MGATGVAVPRGGADILTVGFGTTVAMWVTGYVLRLPGVAAPGAAVAAALAVVAVAGGAIAGRLGPRGYGGGALAGLLTATLNLLVLGSLLAAPGPAGVAGSAALWVPGFLASGAALGALGGVLGGLGRREPRELPWTWAFAAVTAAATFALLVVGGLVTSHRAGLAVVDWPNSFGYNMFLYPLARMTGGVYLEHAHRLFGSLVGLTTLVLAIHLHLVEERRAVRRLALAALAMVVAQGVLGGLRVTGRFTLSTSPADVAPSTSLAVVHGVLGQLVLATLVVLVVALSPAWRAAPEPLRGAAPGAMSLALVGALVLQLILGAVQRHLAKGLLIHVTMAALVAVLAVLVGAGAWARDDAPAPLRRIGRGLVLAVTVQVVLGILALVAVGGLDGGAPREGWRAVLATAHQAVGALLLALAAAQAALSRRLLLG